MIIIKNNKVVFFIKKFIYIYYRIYKKNKNNINKTRNCINYYKL